jgi:hypothetical protein
MQPVLAALVWVTLSAIMIFPVWSSLNGWARIGMLVVGIGMGRLLAAWLLASFGLPPL